MEVVPIGSTVLEIGTGNGTASLAKHYQVISIEHNSEWHKGQSQLIHVPLVDCRSLNLSDRFWEIFPDATSWYDAVQLKEDLTGIRYDAIIIDGPPGGTRRAAMWYFYDQLFNTNVPVLIDDIHRRYEWAVAVKIAKFKKVNSFKVFSDEGTGLWAVIA